ncbi:iron-containing alcohol dehydrogenase family protein [Lacipirellula sp.]|uniref:iron-containing alcohol dehydrogenase family protein n=1 Tax=Lacipirellula sp. TaxID=2691419 RepID=UPI003D0E062D
MTPFDFRLPTRIVFGAGRIDELGELTKSLEASRVLVVSDPGVVSAGHTQRGVDALHAAGLQTCVFEGFAENPNTNHVADGVAIAQQFKPDCIIGLGGGSSMDCAKGINFIYSCGGRIQDYWGVGKATGPLLPMIAVPTTAGTGSETQSFALISDAETHVKMACGDKQAAFRIALLDPALTTTQPSRVTALTGFDALAHAVETAVTKVRTPLSQAFSREAWRHLAPNFLRTISEPDNLEARGEMQLGACLAGLAIENSMLGAAHALANPLTAEYGVTHGDAVALMLPHVVRHNGADPEVEPQYHDLVLATAFDRNTPDQRAGADGLAQFLADAAAKAGLATRLQDQGVDFARLPELAADATKQWTGTFNPVAMSTDDFRRLYEQAY